MFLQISVHKSSSVVVILSSSRSRFSSKRTWSPSHSFGGAQAFGCWRSRDLSRWMLSHLGYSSELLTPKKISPTIRIAIINFFVIFSSSLTMLWPLRQTFLRLVKGSLSVLVQCWWQIESYSAPCEAYDVIDPTSVYPIFPCLCFCSGYNFIYTLWSQTCSVVHSAGAPNAVQELLEITLIKPQHQSALARGFSVICISDLNGAFKRV